MYCLLRSLGVPSAELCIVVDHHRIKGPERTSSGRPSASGAKEAYEGDLPERPSGHALPCILADWVLMGGTEGLWVSRIFNRTLNENSQVFLIAGLAILWVDWIMLY